jgi:hypothetical protein
MRTQADDLNDYLKKLDSLLILAEGDEKLSKRITNEIHKTKSILINIR